MFLFINTAEEKKAVGLIKDKKLAAIIDFKRKFGKSEKILLAIDKLFKKNKIKFSNLSGVIVVTGPGRFSSLRAGVSTANALAYGLDISIKGIKLDEFKDKNFSLVNFTRKIFLRVVFPFYGKEPNITIGKS